MSRVVIASGNAGKLRELTALLAPLGFELLRQSDLGVSEAVEDGPDFVSNALIKARHAAHATGLAAFADDSGLEVDALDGAPGVRSARYAGEDADDAANNAKLLAALQGLPRAQRGACFRCAVVFLASPEAEPLVCEASWRGYILDGPRGEGGFGYDPLFEVDGLGLSSAELDPAEKNRISHRGQALAKLRAALVG